MARSLNPMASDGKPPESAAGEQTCCPRRLLLVATACAAAVAALWFLLPALHASDQAWLRVMTGPHTGPARSAALALDWYGHSASWIGLLVIGLILVLIRRPWSALFVITGRAVAALASTAVKALTGRERPPGQLVEAGGSSFPSGHVCAVAVTVVLVAALLTGTARKVWWVFALIVTIAMAWSRTYLHAHWLTDALAGAALGAAVGFAWWWLFEPRLRSERTLSEIPLPPPRSPD